MLEAKRFTPGELPAPALNGLNSKQLTPGTDFLNKGYPVDLMQR